MATQPNAVGRSAAARPTADGRGRRGESWAFPSPPRIDFAQPRRLFLGRLTAVHGAPEHIEDELLLPLIAPGLPVTARAGDFMPRRLIDAPEIKRMLLLRRALAVLDASQVNFL